MAGGRSRLSGEVPASGARWVRLFDNAHERTKRQAMWPTIVCIKTHPLIHPGGSLVPREGYGTQAGHKAVETRQRN